MTHIMTHRMMRYLCCCFRPNVIEKSAQDINVQITNNDFYAEDLQKNGPVDVDNWLKNSTQIGWNDCIPFVPPIEKGIVIKVYDGDTITIASKLPYAKSPIYRFSVRLSGIDCPEMKSDNAEEKECAQLAKQKVTELLLNKVVTLHNCQTEKYGRILADIYIENFCVNNYLVKTRLAVMYDGGTKFHPKNWMKYHLTGEL